MRLRAHIEKEGKFWTISCESVFAYTFGNTKKEALEALADWFKDILNDPEFPVEVIATGKNEAEVYFPESKPILGLIVSRIRAVHGMTLADAERKTMAHRARFRQIESGKNDPQFTKFNDLLNSLGFEFIGEIRKIG